MAGGDLVLVCDCTHTGQGIVIGCRNCMTFRCASLASLSLPPALCCVEVGAFYCCSSLSSVTLPASLVSIGTAAFDGCSSLASLPLPAGLASIGTLLSLLAALACRRFSSRLALLDTGNHSFHCCSSLTSVAFPASLASIGDGAAPATPPSPPPSKERLFTPRSVNRRLHQLLFPRLRRPPRRPRLALGNTLAANSVSSRPSPTAGLTYLGKTAFYYCTSLASVAIPDGVGLPLRPLPATAVRSAASQSHGGCEQVSSIGPGCFRDCSSLAELRLPSSLSPDAKHKSNHHSPLFRAALDQRSRGHVCELCSAVLSRTRAPCCAMYSRCSELSSPVCSLL